MSKLHELPIWKHFTNFDIKSRTVLLAYQGSMAYGTKTDNTIDRDIMGVCVAPREYYYGLKTFEDWNQQIVVDGETYDVVIYELRKYVRLLLKNNPHTFQLLWSPDHTYLHVGKIGKRLIENRTLFSSTKVYTAHIGYAHAQLDLLKRGMNRVTRDLGKQRKELIEKHGYDTKAALHLIRLLRMCIEFLKMETLNVFRHDHRQLIDIKQGKWTIEQVEEEANRLFKLADEALIQTKLPNAPQYDQVDTMLIDMVQHELAD